MISSVRFACALAATALLTLACGDTSPGSLSGKVTLEGVTGSLEGSFVTVGTAAVATGADGTYRLDGIAPGTVTVRVSHEGFVGEERTVTVATEKTASADFQLSRANVAPVVSALSAAPATLAPSGTSALLASASDANEDALSFTWSADGGFTVTPGEGGAATLTAPDTFAAHGTVTVTVSDGQGGEASAQLQVSTHGNHAPVLSSLTATPPLVQPGQSITLSASAEDPDGAALSYAWTVPTGWALSGTGTTVAVQAPARYGQSGVVTLEVRDPEGGAATGQLTVGTAANRAPVVTSVSATPTQVEKGGTLTVSASATDPDGDPLTYAWSGPDGWTITPDGGSATVEAPELPGQTALLQVVADDGMGHTAQGSVMVGTAANAAPILSSLSASRSEIVPGGQLSVSASASDPDGDPLTYSWSVDDPTWSLSGTGATVGVTAPAEYLSSATVTLSVADGLGGVATASVAVRTSGPPCTWEPDSLQYTPSSSENVVTDLAADSAQVVTPAVDLSLESVVLPLYTCKANGLLDAQVRVTATTADGLPDPSTVLATSPVVPNAQLADACFGGNYFQDVTFTLAFPVPLLAGTSYAIILHAPPSPGTKGQGAIYWRRSTPPADPIDPYAGGEAWQGAEDSWGLVLKADLGFELRGERCAVDP